VVEKEWVQRQAAGVNDGCHQVLGVVEERQGAHVPAKTCIDWELCITRIELTTVVLCMCVCVHTHTHTREREEDAASVRIKTLMYHG
jgi:hypothetical protein